MKQYSESKVAGSSYIYSMLPLVTQPNFLYTNSIILADDCVYVSF